MIHLSYRSALDEAGPEKAFDYSRRTLADRWQVGALDCEEGKRRLSKPSEEVVISVRRTPRLSAA